MSYIQSFFVRIGSEERGPITRDQVIGLLKDGEAADHDLVWTDGMGDWVPLSALFRKVGDAPLIEPPKLIVQQPRPVYSGKHRFCTTCGAVEKPVRKTQGSFWVELALWLFFCMPGMIYSVWRLTSTRKLCPVCGSAGIIPLGSPAARSAMDRLGRPN